jgi:putative transposase
MNSLMWTPTTRDLHKRDGLRFASDVTDAEWAALAPLLPPPSGVGRPPSWPMREVVNAIFYVLRGRVPLANAAGLLSTAADGLWLV